MYPSFTVMCFSPLYLGLSLHLSESVYTIAIFVRYYVNWLFCRAKQFKPVFRIKRYTTLSAKKMD